MAVHDVLNPALKRMVEDLQAALGGRLLSVVLYGSAARGDYTRGTSDFNLLLVLSDLEPDTLERLTTPLGRWQRQGQPAPRVFSPATLSGSADVFPIEFLDLQAAHQVLYGSDLVADLEVHADHLRLQCERELREKLMRLREAYVESHANARALRRLIVESYPTFVALFRGCLRLVGEEPPAHHAEVVATFCARADLDRAAFETVARLKSGDARGLEMKAVFAGYYGELTKAVTRVDRFRELKLN